MSTAGQDTEPVAFKLTQPETIDGKQYVGLGKAGMIVASAQYVTDGGDNNLHAHSAEDEAFLVLTGRIRFYGRDNEVLAELGPMEGIAIPRMFPYWFESASDEVLTIFKIGAHDPRFKNERVNFEGLTEAQIARGDGHPSTGRDATAAERR